MIVRAWIHRYWERAQASSFVCDTFFFNLKPLPLVNAVLTAAACGRLTSPHAYKTMYCIVLDNTYLTNFLINNRCILKTLVNS